MPSRARLDEFIAAVVSGDHAGAIERFYTEDASMQENAAPPRVGRDVLVAHERAVLERVKNVTSTCVTSIDFRLRLPFRQDRPLRRGRAAGMARRQGLARALLLRSVETSRLAAAIC
jgi:hypothetical protein